MHVLYRFFVIHEYSPIIALLFTNDGAFMRAYYSGYVPEKHAPFLLRCPDNSRSRRNRSLSRHPLPALGTRIHNDTVLRSRCFSLRKKLLPIYPPAYDEGVHTFPSRASASRYCPYSVMRSSSPSAFSCSVEMNPRRQAISSMQEI